MSVDWDWLQGYNATPPPAPGTPQYAANQAAVASFLAGTQPPPPKGGGGAGGAGSPPQGPGQASTAQTNQQQQQSFAKRSAKLHQSLKAFRGTRERIQNMPTPGGIGLLVLVLILLLLFIVPVNGKETRANLLFDVGRGAAKLPLPNEPQTQPTADTSGNASGIGHGPLPSTPVNNPAVPQQAVVENSTVSPFLADYSPNGIPMPGVSVTG